MKALSIMQPWAWLIVMGYKDIENRNWPTNFRGKFLVHAGKKFDGKPEEWDWDAVSRDTGRKIIPPLKFDVGGIVGMSEITDCVTAHKSPWFFGEHGFVLGRSRILPFMPLKGQLGFFEAEYDRKLLA